LSKGAYLAVLFGKNKIATFTKSRVAVEKPFLGHFSCTEFPVGI
jgi:hypothetical protein